jgi:hypothetical protein
MPSRIRERSGTAALLSVRFVIRDTSDGLVAECLDAGAIGIGETKSEAIAEMMDALEALFDEHGKAMKVAATARDEEMFRRLEASHPTRGADSNIVAWGRVERGKAFDVASLTPSIAA